MMHASARALLFCFALVLPSAAAGQTVQDWDCKQGTFERIDADRVRLMREAECNGSGPNAGQQFFADEVVWNLTSGEVEAIGNVLVVSPTARLSAERAAFNTKTKLGTFYTASGLASLGERGAKDKSMFGTLEPDIYFHGETIEKTGPDRYVVSKGGFTTCVQPTPRWQVVTGKATINLEDYAILNNAVVRVKDVPVFYLPILYYPIQSDDRATGFLLPTYGRSTYRGQSLSNAFFWAINRSQDVTLYHDWYTKTGQGAGAEYRYAAAPGAQGFVETYWLKEKETTTGSGADAIVTPSRRSYEVRAELAQPLPAGIRASARVDYFSDLTTQQLYNTNIYEASRRQRTVAGSLTGAWSGVSVTGNFRRSELFNTQTESIVNGYAPSFTANLSSRRLGALPLYVAVSSEASRILYLDRRDGTEIDSSLSRFDATPTIRAALTTWPFLSVNGTLAYRHTYFTESLDENRRQVAVPFTRRYLDMKADIVGPVFSRVFTPNNAIADRLKHIIEPNLSFQRITSYDGQNRVPLIAGSYDFIVGGVTRVNYGLTNRVMVRKTPADAPAAAAASAPRELLSMAVTQSYYTDPLASQFDLSYQSSYGQLRPPSSFSPVAVTMRAAPTAFSTGTLRLEYDTQLGRLEGFNAVGSTAYRAAQTSIGWSTIRRDATTRDNALNASTTINLMGGRTGGSYFMDWDIGRKYIIQQRWIGFYNAQCCGLAVEYQEFNFRLLDPRIPIPRDRRFNLSFTLAGIGTFSNFFGAFGGSRY